MDSLQNLIKRKKQRLGFKRPLEIYELFEQWNLQAKRVFGDKKIRCHPKALRGKVLIVQVEGAPLASELQLRAHEFIEKINQHFERKMVERIMFKL